MPYIGKSPDLNASVDTNELADGSVTVSKLSSVTKSVLSSSFAEKAGSPVSASFHIRGASALSASFIDKAGASVSASFMDKAGAAVSASFVTNVQSGSFASGSDVYSLMQATGSLVGRAVASASFISKDGASVSASFHIKGASAFSQSFIAKDGAAVSGTFATRASVSSSLTSGNESVQFDQVTGSSALFTGRMTVGEVFTQYVSSSVLVESIGSTKLGNSTDDLHQITGSVSVLSGSLILRGTAAAQEKISGSAYSTGSFGKLLGEGGDITGITAPAITSIAGTAANQILTDDGDTTVTSESTLTYDGTTFGVDDAAVFNESGNDNDFRVEGDTEEYLLFCDASTDRVGIGTATPANPFHVQVSNNADMAGKIENTHATAGHGLKIIAGDSSSENILVCASQAGTDMLYVKGNGDIEFKAANAKISGSSTSTGSFGRVEINPGGGGKGGFHVRGAPTVSNSTYPSPDNIINVDANTNFLGINVGTPLYPLDIWGYREGGSYGYIEYCTRIKTGGDRNTSKGLLMATGKENASGTNYSITIASANGTVQGDITFSGGTVSYGTFSANHDAKLPNAVSSSGYDYGTLVQINSIYYKQNNGEDSERGILYDVQATTGSYVRNVLGAYGGKYDDKDNLHQIYVLGDGHIICNGEKGNLAVGDGICSSTTVGQGMKADKMAMCIGIAQVTASFSGSETQLVPVQYGLQQFTPWE